MQTFRRSQSGAIMPIFAICIMTLVGIVAVALAIASDSKAANDIQKTADASALAGATAFISLDTPKAEERLAQAFEEAKNFAIANSEYTLVDLDVAAVTEDVYGQQTKITMELEFQPANIMARVAGRSGNISIRRTATADAVWGFPLCLLSLASDGAGISTLDSAQLSSENCIAWSNSTGSSSMQFRSGTVKAQGFCAAGGVIGASNSTPTAESDCDVIPDPLANWSAPPPGTCTTAPEELQVAPGNELLAALAAFSSTAMNFLADEMGGGDAGMELAMAEAQAFLSEGVGGYPIIDAEGRFLYGPAKGLTLEEILQIAGQLDNADPATYADDQYSDSVTTTLTPGTYCGLDIAKGHIKMEPGVYHIKDAPLTVRRRATLTGEGVTIVLSGKAATFSVLDEARLTLSGPETGDTAGFALVEDVDRHNSEPETSNNSNDDVPGLLALAMQLQASSTSVPETRLVSRLTGSGEINAIGTIYIPHHEFRISGSGAGKQASPLLQIVAHRITMNEQGSLKINFDPTQTQVPAGIKPKRTARLVN